MERLASNFGLCSGRYPPVSIWAPPVYGLVRKTEPLDSSGGSAGACQAQAPFETGGGGNSSPPPAHPEQLPDRHINDGGTLCGPGAWPEYRRWIRWTSGSRICGILRS